MDKQKLMLNLKIASLIAHHNLPFTLSRHINLIGCSISEHSSWVIVHPLLKPLDGKVQ
jgi:hypothetical protein